jgi:serine/threonine protein kinase
VAAKPVISGVPTELVGHPRYRVLKLLGQGGMGAVYLAEHLVMGRRVALKTIHTRFLSNPDAVSRFRREVRVAAQLGHPNIVTAYDAEQAGDLHFLVMEFVEGMSVAEYTARKGPLPVEQACSIGSQVALGLQHAHEKGLVHRDIKPANLMLTSKGQVKILDFGLAHFARQEQAGADDGLTATGTVLGSADYIAPEQTSSSRRVDIRADIYSLGCTLYYLLSGRVPFPEGTVIDKFIHHAMDAPPPLGSLRAGLPPGLLEVVAKMMAKKPEDRYQTPTEAARALRPFAEASRIPAAQAVAKPVAFPVIDDKTIPESPAPRKRADHRKKIIIVLAAVGLTMLLFASLVVYALTSRSSPSKQDSGIAQGGALNGKGTGTAPSTAKPGPINVVSWEGKTRRQLFSDPQRGLGEFTDFRDIAGCTLNELHDWQGSLGPGYRPFLLSARKGTGPPLFNAVYIKDKEPAPIRFCPDMTEQQAEKTWNANLEEQYRPIGHCCYVKDGQLFASNLWLKGSGTDYGAWFGTLQFIIEKNPIEGWRPLCLDEVINGGDLSYATFQAPDDRLKYEIHYTLSRAELIEKAEHYRNQNWRPDVLSAHWDGNHFRFMLVTVNNRDRVDWTLRTDMTKQEYRKESDEQKGQGRFPLAITSYGDEVNVRYAAVWVRNQLGE